MTPNTVRQFTFVTGRVKNALDEAALLAAEFEMPENIFAAYCKEAYLASKQLIDEADAMDADRASIAQFSISEEEIDDTVHTPDAAIESLAKFVAALNDEADKDIEVGHVYDIDQTAIGGLEGRVVVTNVDEEEDLVEFRWISGIFADDKQYRYDAAGFDFFEKDQATFVSARPEAAVGQVWESGIDEEEGAHSVYILTGRHTAPYGTTGWNYESDSDIAWLRDGYFTGDFGEDVGIGPACEFIGFLDDPNFELPEVE